MCVSTNGTLFSQKCKTSKVKLLLNKNILYLWKKYLPNSKMISWASCAYSPYGRGFSYTKETFAVQRFYYLKILQRVFMFYIKI